MRSYFIARVTSSILGPDLQWQCNFASPTTGKKRGLPCLCASAGLRVHVHCLPLHALLPEGVLLLHATPPFRGIAGRGFPGV
jgi:hypothetical protein